MATFSKLTYSFSWMPNKIPVAFSETGKKLSDSKIRVEIQEAQISQNNFKKEEQSWRTSQFQNLAQSYSNQDNKVLA